jgi:hypothetical protein
MVVFKENSRQDVTKEQIMTAGDVSAFLKVSINAVRRWTRDGKLKGHRLGGAGDWRYLKRDVLFFLCGSN